MEEEKKSSWFGSLIYATLLVVLSATLVIQNTPLETFIGIKDAISEVSFSKILPPKAPIPPIVLNGVFPQDQDTQTINMVFPTVLWETNWSDPNSGGKASGVLLSRNGNIYVVTTAHSLANKDNVRRRLKEGKSLDDIVDNSKYSVTAMVGNTSKRFFVHVLYVDPTSDFLIAELISPKSTLPYGQQHLGIPFPLFTANMATMHEPSTEKYFTPVVVVGYPGSLVNPAITTGMISTVYPDGLLGITAQIIPGNSGGPVYDANTNELVAIISSVYKMNFSIMNTQIITHLSRAVPIREVEEAFEKEIDQK